MSILHITPECINEVMSCKISTTPVAGMLGTMYVGSDRYTVVCECVHSPKKVRIIEFANEKFLKNRFTKDGVEYIPEDDLKALIENKTPHLESYIARYGEEDGREIYDWEMKRHESEGEYSLRKNGRWMPKGSSAWSTCSIHWGFGDEYRDPCF